MNKIDRRVLLPLGSAFTFLAAVVAGCGQTTPLPLADDQPGFNEQGDGISIGGDDPTFDDDYCGKGMCIDGGYCDNCACYAPDAPISIAMCKGVVNPSCCNPSLGQFTAGVPDNFSTANGTESPSPSPGLTTWINNKYGFLGARDFDDPQTDRYFAHTFAGLKPKDGQYICGAKLRSNVSQSVYSAGNDAIWLRFADGNGELIGPSWTEYLSNLGVPSGSSGNILVDLGSLPNGQAFLAAMENGWLDIVIHDDTMVDDLGLSVEYCCCNNPKPPQLSGIVGYWSLNEPVGPTSVDSIQTNNGTWAGPPTPTAGYRCGALEFDGVQDQEVTAISSALNFGTGDFSVHFRMKTTDLGLNKILDKRVETSGPVQGWAVFTYSGALSLQLGDGVNPYANYISSAFVADGQWHDVAITVRRGSTSGIEVYLDKTLVSTLDPTANPGSLSNSIPMTIGRRSDNPGSPGFFPGTLDEVSLFNRALTAAEVQTL